MKHLRTAIGILALVFAVSALQAQSPQADKLIKQSKAKFEGLKDLKASFVYTLNNPNLKKPIVKQGTIVLKGEKYKIEFADESMYCNGKYLWVLLVEDEEIIKSDVDAESSITPDRLYKVYEEDTKTKYDGVENGAEKISLFSNKKTGDIWKTELWINKSNKLIDKAVMHARNGSTYTYVMSDLQSNLGINDGIFNLNEAEYESKDWIITDQTDM
ncbi:MAG: outer membrane lipoprotein carrier protein LolA [Bacteroidota bacterium]